MFFSGEDLPPRNLATDALVPINIDCCYGNIFAQSKNTTFRNVDRLLDIRGRQGDSILGKFSSAVY